MRALLGTCEPSEEGAWSRLTAELLWGEVAEAPRIGAKGLTAQDVVDQLTQVGELGQPEPLGPSDTLGHPSRLEAKLRGFLQPQAGVRHRADLGRQGDLAEHHRLRRDRTLG